MGAFGGLIQTNKGRNLQAKAEAGALLKFTRMGIGDGQLGGQSIPTLNKLISEKKSLPITRLKPQLPAQAIVGAVLSNQDVTTGFYFREIGIFAQDPDEGEILYAYGNAGSGAEYIPPAGTEDIIEKTIDMIVTFGQAQNVSAVINSSLIFATPEDVAEALTESKKYTDQKIVAAETPSGPATGTVVNGNTVYTAALSPALSTLKAFQRVVIKVNVASTGAPTLNPNGLGAKSVLKASGSAASFKANGVYTLVYDGTAFILQGEGGEVGTATAPDVLQGKTFPGEDGLVTGTMPNYSRAVLGQDYSQAVSAKGDGGGNIVLEPKTGYYEQGKNTAGFGSVLALDPNYKSENIKAGTSIFGVSGKSTVVDTADAVLDPQYLLVGQSGYDDGVKKAGQMPNRSAENNHMPGLESTVWAGDRFFIRPPHGYFNGSTWVTAAVPGLTANNLRAGVNIAGLLGTLDPNMKMAQAGLGNSSYGSITNLPFKPILLLISGYYDNGYVTLSGTVGSYFDGSTVHHIISADAWPKEGSGTYLSMSEATFGSNFVNFALSQYSAQARGYKVFGV
ncbi:phage tail protein [Paenibacillus sp. FSL K6-1330]|uniref:phage tail-collar fiber domain-containing protein n=1 Tax=Paenibacillus sp. FSL K6-1330 TaxID=2975292 RepID=UPI0030D8BF39